MKNYMFQTSSENKHFLAEMHAIASSPVIVFIRTIHLRTFRKAHVFPFILKNQKMLSNVLHGGCPGRPGANTALFLASSP